MYTLPYRRWWGWMMLCGMCLGLVWGLPSPQVHAGTPLPSNVPLLAVYILAYDNRPTSAMDLTPHYRPTLQSLIAASRDHPEKLIVVLADLHAVGDTHIRVIYDGTVNTMFGLPNQSGQLDPQLTEYDTTDAATLGGFLLWVRQRFQSEQSLLTYIGHGTPLVPQTDFSAIWGANPRPDTPAGPAAPLPPLPTNIGANPDLTDHHTPPGSPLSYGVLTPYAFAEALRIGNTSQQPFDVIDVVMCFAASIEEFYELAPFAQVLVGSPNYAFFDPQSPGRVLDAIIPGQTPQAIGQLVVDTYHTLLPAIQHPRILAAIDSTRLENVKAAWDEVSMALLALLRDPVQRDATRVRIRDAYRSSIKYDLTQCAPHNWEIATPDGLVDLRHFAVQLEREFAGTAVEPLTQAAQDEIYDSDANTGAVYHWAALSDVPWFAPGVAPWTFTGPFTDTVDDDALGLSIYADLLGQSTPNGTMLSWHAHWYHDDATVADNSQPFQFLKDTLTADGWDEVFQEYWAGETLTTAACMPEFPHAREPEPITDLAVQRLPQPSRRVLSRNQPVTFGADVSTTTAVHSFLVHFEVEQHGAVVYDQLIHSQPLIRGRHLVQAPTPWLPTATGRYTVSITVDSDARLIEFNETNNQRSFIGEIRDHAPLPVLRGQVKDGQQLVSTLEVALELVQDQPAQAAIERLALQVYQFEPDENGNLQPVLRGFTSLPASLPAMNLPLPQNLEPGAVALHIWGMSRVGRTLEPLIVQLNYAPRASRLAAGESDVYRFRFDRGDMVKFALAVAPQGNADLYLWEPLVDHRPTQTSTLPGSDDLQLDYAPLKGWYTLVVQGDQNQPSTYTLAASRNNAPVARAQGPVQPLLLTRPRIIEPPLRDPWQIYVPLVRKR